MKAVVVIGLLLLSALVWSADIVDIYGLKGSRATHIIKKYAPRIGVLETQAASEYLKEKPDLLLLQQLSMKRKNLINEIKHDGSFAFVDVQTVNYPGNKNMYTTIEIIKRHQPDRLRFVNHHPKVYPARQYHDVIDTMHEYELMVSKLMMNQPTILDKIPCPVYHCLISFSAPELKSYLPLFNEGMKRDKLHIINTLNMDKNPERRGAAAFLLGHAQDPYDILTILLPHVTDPDYHVRNNVLRVIAETISKAHITDLDPSPFLELLDSPYVTDRNKALAILVTIADSPRGKNKMMLMGRQRLLNLLSLKQPNNHNLAYAILKKISHKNYGDREIAAWSSWLTHQQIS